MKKLELSPIEQANAQIKEISEKISSTLKTTLDAFGLKKDIHTVFNREWFRMDIFINEKEHFISVQGRGGNIEMYYEEMLEIVKLELQG